MIPARLNFTGVALGRADWYQLTKGGRGGGAGDPARGEQTWSLSPRRMACSRVSVSSTLKMPDSRRGLIGRVAPQVYAFGAVPETWHTQVA